MTIAPTNGRGFYFSINGGTEPKRDGRYGVFSKERYTVIVDENST